MEEELDADDVDVDEEPCSSLFMALELETLDDSADVLTELDAAAEEMRDGGADESDDEEEAVLDAVLVSEDDEEVVDEADDDVGRIGIELIPELVADVTDDADDIEDVASDDEVELAAEVLLDDWGKRDGAELELVLKLDVTTELELELTDAVLLHAGRKTH